MAFAHVEQFMEAFYRMPDGRTRLCHVLDTWKNVFPDALVQSIRSSIPAAVPAAAPPHPSAQHVAVPAARVAAAPVQRVIHPVRPVQPPVIPQGKRKERETKQDPSVCFFLISVSGTAMAGNAFAPPEKRLRLDSMIEQQERDIAAQALQALVDLEVGSFFFLSFSLNRSLSTESDSFAGHRSDAAAAAADGGAARRAGRGARRLALCPQ